MRRHWPTAAMVVVTAGVYAATLVIGFKVEELSMPGDPMESRARRLWTPPPRSSIPNDARGERIRRGESLFNETPLYAARFTQAKVSCSSCHAEGGMQPFASPMVGLPALFPMYNDRAGHVISLEDRIQECFVRSENGRPLDYKGGTMQSIEAYIEWLSLPEPNREKFRGRGLVLLPALKPDVGHGAEIYEQQCAGCHGEHGEGKLPQFPPLWGPESFNDGAGMNGVNKMAAFVQHNMPQNRMGILSAQEAYDVSAFVHAQPRPAFNPAYKSF